MLDISENISLTDPRKTINEAKEEDHRNRTRGRMIPRRISHSVKIALIIIGLTVIILMIMALTAGNRMSEVNESVPQFSDSNSSNLTLTLTQQEYQKAPKEGSFVFNRQASVIRFKDADSHDDYLNIYVKAFNEGNKLLFKSAKIMSNIECLKNNEKKGEVLCLTFGDKLSAAVQREDISSIDCQTVEWVSYEDSSSPSSVEHCIDLEDNWYGGGALSRHRWPLNRVNVPMQAFITRKFRVLNPHQGNFESFLEPYFVSASGVAIILDPYLPLFVSINHDNNKKLCFKSVFEKPYHLEKEQMSVTLLKYKVCKDKVAKDIHQRLLNSKILGHPVLQPCIDLLQKPVWSTRGFDIQNINEVELLKYIKSLKSSNLPFSQLFIDGNYSRSPGSVYFNEKKFPHSAQLMMELDFGMPDKKMKVAIEVLPLLPNLSTKARDISLRDVKTTEGAKYLDFSDTEGVQWFTSQLHDISNQIKVKGFRFSGGHAASPLRNSDMSNLGMKKILHPNKMTHEYGEIASLFHDRSFLGSGYKSQKHGLIADAGPFTATWDHGKGLQSIIPTVITYGLIGYLFVNVGPIGGINYNVDNSTGLYLLPDRNLYIRWLQLTSFLPVMEFSVGPWQYNDQVLNYTKFLLTYRQNRLWSQYFLPAVKEATESGIPIIRPLWWIAPKDKTAQFIDCEFMLGDNLLVVPVLVSNHLSRQVYLPEGSWWEDILRGGMIYKGGQWLHDYHVGYFEIAHFLRKTSGT